MTEAVVAFLREVGREVPTATVIAAMPGIEPWRVRQLLDELADANVVTRRRGRNSGKVWRLNANMSCDHTAR
jgi:DNA-binding IscR family transcriptional regulator